MKKIREHAQIFIPPNTTDNSDLYGDVLRRLTENLLSKRSELWRNHNWLLRDVPTHMSLKTTEFGLITWLSFTILPTCWT
jgi:hypothetical protein